MQKAKEYYKLYIKNYNVTFTQQSEKEICKI